MKNRQKDLVAQLSDKELLWNFYVSQLFIFCIGILFSRLIFQNWFYPFSLFDWSDTKIMTVGLSAALFVIIMDVCFMKFLPKTVYDDGGINERLFSNRRRWHIVVMTIIVAFGEEILFRGVLQTAFGLVIASLLFAFVHFRYLFQPFLFANVVILSFVIGVIFQMTDNLAVCVFMHFIIDCALGLIIHSKKNQNHPV